jgi:hypothetical protein
MKTTRHFSNDYFVDWFSKGLQQYLDNTFKEGYNTHIEDLIYSTEAYTEAVSAFIANQP